MTGYISKKMLGAARLPDTPSARAYLKKVLEDDDTQVYKKPWVGLTDADWKEIEDMPDTFDQGVAWAQAKLKEKNT
jgi:hypothetical protein